MRVYPFARFLSAGNGALDRSAGGRSASADFHSTPSFGRTWRFWVCAGMLPPAFFLGMHLANYRSGEGEAFQPSTHLWYPPLHGLPCFSCSNQGDPLKSLPGGGSPFLYVHSFGSKRFYRTKKTGRRRTCLFKSYIVNGKFVIQFMLGFFRRAYQKRVSFPVS